VDDTARYLALIEAVEDRHQTLHIVLRDKGIITSRLYEDGH
jgi:hypothetical protein